MKEIEFWFSIGSTYTNLSVTRLKEVEQKFEVKFYWQPFSVSKDNARNGQCTFSSNKAGKGGLYVAGHKATGTRLWI